MSDQPERSWGRRVPVPRIRPRRLRGCSTTRLTPAGTDTVSAGAPAIGANVHVHAGVAQLDPGPGTQRHGAGHPAAIEERAIARAGVLERGDAIRDHHARVGARDAGILELQVAVGRAADEQGAVEGNAVAARQDEVEMTRAVARRAAGPTARIGTSELAATHGAEHLDGERWQTRTGVARSIGLTMEEVLKRVGRYDLLEVVGRGGAAVVYLAHQRDLQRRVALKELAPQHAETDFAPRFVEESRLAASLSHPNVVTVHEYFEQDGVPYIAMEYLPHGSLRQYVGRLSSAQIAGVLEGVLAGLSHGERHGIVHRDLKPENLLVSGDGRVKIADFGVARAYNRATHAVVTQAGTTIGTPAYMAPEQALGSPLTPATDLYSLGVVAWELLAGQLPFEDNDTPVALLYRHVHEPVPSVRSVTPDVDERIAQWLERLLAKRGEDRFACADEAWDALEDVILDLLGPRWRRQARLVVEGAEPPEPETLAPAWFEDAPAPVAETHADPPPVRAPQTTVAPQRRLMGGHTTLMRIARRRRAGATQEAQAGATGARRRRLLAGAVLLVMAAAAVVGVLVARPSGHTQSAAQRQAAVAAATNRQLAAVVGTLAASRTRLLSSLERARTPAQQVSAATAVQKAYTTAAAQARPLAARTVEASQVHATLAATAGAYGGLAAAARTHSSPGWNRAADRHPGRRAQAPGRGRAALGGSPSQPVATGRGMG